MAAVVCVMHETTAQPVSRAEAGDMIPDGPMPEAMGDYGTRDAPDSMPPPTPSPLQPVATVPNDAGVFMPHELCPPSWYDSLQGEC